MCASKTDWEFRLDRGWRPLTALDEDRKRLLKGSDALLDARVLEACEPLGRVLPFFSHALLVYFRSDTRTSFGLYGVWGNQGLHLLRGEVEDVRAAVQRYGLELTADTVVPYLWFYCMFVHGSEGPFRILREPSDLLAPTPGPGSAIKTGGGPLRYEDLSAAVLAERIAAPAVLGGQDGADWRIAAAVQYAEALSACEFTVKGSGEVDMAKSETLVVAMPVNQRRNRMALPEDLDAQVEQADTLLELLGNERLRAVLPAYLNERALEASIQHEFARLLLVRALREGQASPLYPLRADLDDDALLADFAGFVLDDVHPIVIVESPVIYMERLIVDLLREAVDDPAPANTAGASSDGSGAAEVTNLVDGQIVQISLHEFHSIARPQALAYAFGVTDCAAIIGCDAQSRVPEAVRRSADIVLRLEGVDGAFLRELFLRLFGREIADALREEDEVWYPYVAASDLYQPMREWLEAVTRASDDGGWSPQQALASIRERIAARLGAMTSGSGPALEELHGLGDAAVVARDLVRDVRAAVAGDIAWDEVDRGVLLVGEPGTGKTMLARAIARACGVNFVAASAAAWVAGTQHLGQHLGRIRAAFADARRYAPSILFIDEMDSIGNRERFAGSNRQYSVEVVNALLQELQGVEAQARVFVIAATNHLYNIDPALTRAGRLDQVIRISKPNRRALAAILQDKLRPFAATGRVADDVDHHHLAGLAIGATGADIEFFVRDAARRARRERVRIDDRHLAAAITRAPRRPHLAGSAHESALERTAVHEAGHAVAGFLCKDYRAELGMISIIPRDDGKLGFTAMLPSERQYLTRTGYRELLQVLLAGRAAEELVYGAAGVSGGAGGESQSSDLARATEIAAAMVCSLGLAGDVPTRWSAAPSHAEHLDAVRELLAEAYAEALRTLARHRGTLEALRDRLVQEQEILRSDIEALMSGDGTSSAAANEPPQQR